MLMEHIKSGNTQVLADVRRVGKYGANEVPSDPKDVRMTKLTDPLEFTFSHSKA